MQIRRFNSTSNGQYYSRDTNIWDKILYNGFTDLSEDIKWEYNSDGTTTIKVGGPPKRKNDREILNDKEYDTKELEAFIKQFDKK